MCNFILPFTGAGRKSRLRALVGTQPSPRSLHHASSIHAHGSIPSIPPSLQAAIAKTAGNNVLPLARADKGVHVRCLLIGGILPAWTNGARVGRIAARMVRESSVWACRGIGGSAARIVRTRIPRQGR